MLNYSPIFAIENLNLTIMKKRISTLVSVFTLAGIMFVANAREVAVDVKTIPLTAQEFIKENFSEKKLLSVVKESEVFCTEYEAFFADGSKVKFNSKGEWEEVDGNKGCLPVSAIPEVIADYITANYAGICICKIEKDDNLFNMTYDVELLNGIDLKFDKNGGFLGFDD